MKMINRIIIAAAILMGTATTTAHAQYYQLANQATNMISTALSGGVNYRGYADVGYLAGLGDKRADILSISTTQGVKFSNTFFMGVGLGVDVMFCDVADVSRPPQWGPDDKGFTETGVAIPLFTDFRLNFGAPGSVGFYADLKIGASFLVGNDYIRVGDGYLTNSESFYLKPAIGMRIPVSGGNSKYAFNVGVNYQLTTSNYWYVNSNNITLSSLGVNVGFEW